MPEGDTVWNTARVVESATRGKHLLLRLSGSLTLHSHLRMDGSWRVFAVAERWRGGLVGIYTDPRHVILYTSNGEVRQEFSVVFTARPIEGEPTPQRRVTGGPLGHAESRTIVGHGSVDEGADRALPRGKREAAPWLAHGLASARTSSKRLVRSAPSS